MLVATNIPQGKLYRVTKFALSAAIAANQRIPASEGAATLQTSSFKMWTRVHTTKEESFNEIS